MPIFKHYIADDTVVYVEFDYSREQKEILWPAEKSQPGIPAEVEVTGVFVSEDDISSCLNEECLQKLEESCWDNLPA